MNERIRLLADEAGLRFTQLMSNPMVPIVDGKETDLEKFAQLVASECADIAQAGTAIAVSDAIRERFGVKL
jgi:hypothetical protein